MPPLPTLPTMISEATKRRLEHTYAPTQSLEDSQPHHTNSCAMTAIQQILPARPVRSLTPSADEARQERRSLPTRAVNDDNFDDAYVDFIMYCNPTVTLDTDTTELRKILRAPPKSDGKAFSTFTLFQLIRRLESKEIKTWAQLAIELGVEPPALDKGQSAQKVQQYAVRLKRWMHAMHVDAFFEYLLNKAHVYWTQVPSINEPISEFGRDGVTAEEDLALRALLPETRPKRGRRKAEERENDSDAGKSPSQRRRLESPTLSEDFMIARASLIADSVTPVTAHPGFHGVFGRLDPDRIDPWSTTDVRAPMSTSFRWGAPDITQTPMSAYPQSAITPTNRTQLWSDEPQSAITPNKTRSRRRHGPAVSSAWPSNGSASSGKLRGRPPSNRSTIDGPFSTFPANPNGRDVPTINLRDNTPTATPIVADSETPRFFPPDLSTPKPPNPPAQSGRPSRLQLQVPERQGGAVRLATPPPVVLVNGEGSSDVQSTTISNAQPILPTMEYFNVPADEDPSFQHFVSIAFRQNEDTDRTNVDALESHFICEILAADWYDVGGNSIERCSIDEAAKICKQVVKNLQTESSSTEAFLINLSALAGGPLMTRLKMTKLDYESRIDYECRWKMRFGSIEGDFTIRATVQRTPDTATIQNEVAGDTEQTWKKRYLDLQQQIRERDEKVGKLKRGVLDALVDSNQYSTF